MLGLKVAYLYHDLVEAMLCIPSNSVVFMLTGVQIELIMHLGRFLERCIR